MRTQYYTAATLDGYLADTNNSLDWLFEVDDDGQTEPAVAEYIHGVGALAMGATTYEWIIANQTPQDWTNSYGDRPCWVFTHRQLPVIPGANVRFVSGEVEPVHKEMAAAAGERNIWLLGGGELVGQFADAGLLDDVIVSVAPVTLGAGAPLLPRRILSSRMRLTDIGQFGQFALLTYQLGQP